MMERCGLSMNPMGINDLRMELEMVERLEYSLALSILDSRDRFRPKSRMNNLLLCNTIGSYFRQLLRNQHINLNLEEGMNVT